MVTQANSFLVQDFCLVAQITLKRNMQLQHALVLQVPQYPKLPERALREGDMLEDILDLFSKAAAKDEATAAP